MALDEVTAARPRPRLELLSPPSVDTPDAELVERARAGEGWAQEMLYRRHVAMVASTARRLLRHAGEAEDVVQETFLCAFERLHQLVDPAAIRGWLARIAVSRVHRRFRRRRFLAWFGTESEEETLASQAHPGASPEQRAELTLLDVVLAAMPHKLRTPWVLRHVVGHTIEDTAAACGCSLATVKRRLAAADERVARHVEEDRRG